MKVKVTNIDYCIEREDVADIVAMDLYGENYDCEEQYDSEFFSECDKKIDEYRDTLPSEMEIEIDGDGDIEDEISDKISDKTGFLINSFLFEYVPEFVKWDDLKEHEKEQAINTYLCIREMEERRSRDETTPEYPEPMDWRFVKECKLQRNKTGYIEVII